MEVYARAARVRLLVNGRTVGEKALKGDCIARFRCTYEDGTVTAVALDAHGAELGRTTLGTAGPETQLRADPEAPSVAPGRLSYIRLRYTDGEGITKPLERGMLKVTVTGGALLGLGSACPYNEGSYLSQETDTYYGEALAVVRAGEAGTVTLTVADGTYTACAAVAITPAE